TAVRAPARPSIAFEARRPAESGPATFVGRGHGYSLVLQPGQATVLLHKPRPAAVVRMQLSGASAAATMAGLESLPRKIYYVDGSSAGTLTPNETFERVKASNVYPGIDLTYYANDRHLEFDFLVAPHADAHLIRLQFDGAGAVSLADDGAAVLRMDTG